MLFLTQNFHLTLDQLFLCLAQVRCMLVRILLIPFYAFRFVCASKPGQLVHYSTKAQCFRPTQKHRQQPVQRLEVGTVQTLFTAGLKPSAHMPCTHKLYFLQTRIIKIIKTSTCASVIHPSKSTDVALEGECLKEMMQPFPHPPGPESLQPRCRQRPARTSPPAASTPIASATSRPTGDTLDWEVEIDSHSPTDQRGVVDSKPKPKCSSLTPHTSEF